MNKHTREVLEFDKTLGLVARFASSEAGADRVMAMAPLGDSSEIAERLGMISEMRKLIEWDKTVSLGGIRDVREAASKAKTPGSALDARTLLAVAELASTAGEARSFVREHRDQAGLLWKLASQLEDVGPLEKRIRDAIDEDTNIRDTASPTLKRLRQEKGRVSARISESLSRILASEGIQSHLRESIVTIRNGRYVIPVRSESKRKIEGIVHDTSQSGATVFIEPMTTVALNNRLRGLELEEKDEILRILRELTLGVGELSQELILDFELLAELDLLKAAARFSIEFDCSRPGINCEGRTSIRAGRHPLLEATQRARGGEAVVPLDIAAGSDKRGLLITGPNAGGKTVALKTVGVFTLLARAGLHLPCKDGTDVALFDKVYVDIGDEQSIELSLSTFSSHMRNTIGILEAADENTLVLLDEVGAGTDPTEGAALARTIIEELLAKGATVIATTHHMSLKVFAHENPLIANASMEFDGDNLRPTYRLLQGIPGSSHAFEIAARLGMDENLLARARAHCGQEQVRFEELTRDLLERMRRIAEEEASVEAKRDQADKVLAEYQERLAEIARSDREIRKRALKEAKGVVDDARREVRELVGEIREREHRSEEVRRIEGRIRAKSGEFATAIRRIEDAEEDRPPLERIEAGARAFVRPLGRDGVILSTPDERGRLEVVVGAMRVEVDVSDLFEPSAPEAARPKGTVEFEAKEVPSEISVRGQTAEEALEGVDKYLYDAALYGYNTVRIVHGKGRGILGRRIREMLGDHPRVKSHRYGGLGEGGTGVTFVELDTG
jgi:DNA mismatch repair protein MutS2